MRYGGVALALLAAACTLLLMLSPRLAESLLFFPPRVLPGEAPRVAGVAARDIRLEAADGTVLHAWWFEAGADAPAVLFLHGNASHIGQLGFQAEAMVRRGISILLLSYRGYGRSEGRPTEVGVTLDARAGLDWLSEQTGGPDRVVVHGRSVGGGVAGGLLRTGTEPAGVILESTFTNLFEIARTVYPFVPGFLLSRLRGRFDTRTALEHTEVPALIVHGTEDGLVPTSMGRALREAAGERATFIEIAGATHNDLPIVGGESYMETIAGFVRRVTRSP